MSQCEQNRDETNSQILTKIYEEYGGFIQSVLRFSLRNQQDREDVYQEIFITLLKKDDLSEIQNMKGYLYRLVINKVNEFLRTKIAQEHNFKEYVKNLQVQPTGECLHETAAHEQANKMMAFIQEHLSPKLAEAILVRFQYHYDIEKAAKKMNVKKGTIIHNVSLGLTKIRSILKKQERAKKNKEGDNYEL